MELKDFELNPEFVGKAIYQGVERAPRQVNGKPGTYTRHVLVNEKHGIFHVITPTLNKAFEFWQEVEIDGDCSFYEDYFYGRDVSPSMNVFAVGLKLVGGK